MKRAIIGILLLTSTFAFVGCTHRESAEPTLYEQGFSEIKIIGSASLLYSEDESLKTTRLD